MDISRISLCFPNFLEAIWFNLIMCSILHGCVSTRLCGVYQFFLLGLDIFGLAPRLYFRVGKQQDFVKLRQQTSGQRREWDAQSSACFTGHVWMCYCCRQWKPPRLLVQSQSVSAAAWTHQWTRHWLPTVGALPCINWTSIRSSVCWLKWRTYTRLQRNA